MTEEQKVRITEFLHEAGALRRTPRSGYQFLGSGSESVAEHSHRTSIIGYVLARLANADVARTVFICLFHDLGEARVSDHNYVNQRYVTSRERDAVADATNGTGFADDILACWDEHANAAASAASTASASPVSLEGRLARDADQLDLILNLKRELDLGNPYAAKWIATATQRLRTDVAKDLCTVITTQDHTSWWAGKG